MSYKSPIEIYVDDVICEFDGDVMKVCQKNHIEVDREELIKALEYDRGQYKKGYEDGVNSVNGCIPVSWLTAQAENPSNSDEVRNAIDYIVYKLWAEKEKE